jgi:hypothetical protein
MFCFKASETTGSFPTESSTIKGVVESLFRVLARGEQIEPPYTAEAGLHGVKGRNLVNNGSVIGNARVFEDSFELRDVLHSTDLTTQDKFLREFFELMHGQTGYSRPPKLYGFPPDRVATPRGR